MKVRMLESVGSVLTTYVIHREYDLTDEKAADFINRKLAVPAGTPVVESTMMNHGERRGPGRPRKEVEAR